MATSDWPLAVAPLTSYRYWSRWGWVMIGALDENDALREAGRSLERGVTPDPANLEIWDGEKYVPVRNFSLDDRPLA